MLVVQLMLAGIAIGMVLGFAMLFRSLQARLAEQQRAFAELKSDIARLFGDARDGELIQAVRHLDAALSQVDEDRAERRNIDERYRQLSEDSRRDRDWQRLFESGR
ncbi:MAG: hypothetical protein J7494_00185 [Sphingobium sp.]|nr:hypothetical protein [Sphingobium sp.]